MTPEQHKNKIKHLADISEVVALRRVLSLIRENDIETVSQVKGLIYNELEELGYPYEENPKVPF